MFKECRRLTVPQALTEGEIVINFDSVSGIFQVYATFAIHTAPEPLCIVLILQMRLGSQRN